MYVHIRMGIWLLTIHCTTVRVVTMSMEGTGSSGRGGPGSEVYPSSEWYCPLSDLRLILQGSGERSCTCTCR